MIGLGLVDEFAKLLRDFGTELPAMTVLAIQGCAAAALVLR